MLVAMSEGGRVDAAAASKGARFDCPHCHGEVILKRGRFVIAHFAHKPPTDCTWASGETRAHLEAKALLAQALASRGLKAEVEVVVECLPGDRRADVMAWGPHGRAVAFELQHTPIGPEEIERRSFSYANSGVAQIWIPFIRQSVWNDGERRGESGWFLARYSPRPFEKWVHGLCAGRGMWMYDPVGKQFWLGRLAGHQIYVEETSWYSEGGDEETGGGFYRWSKRYKELTLTGPYAPERLHVRVTRRKAFGTKEYKWPAGLMANLEPF